MLKNKLPVKSDVHFCQREKEQRLAVLFGNLVSLQARQAARALAVRLQRKNPERCRAMHC